MMWVIGWLFANARSPAGIEVVGTNALEAKVNGNSQMKPADCTASTLRTASPTVAPTQEKAKLINSSRPIAPEIIRSEQPTLK